MSCETDVGPGQNITFFLITTGLDINPNNGTVGSYNYEFLKNVISEKAELLYEDPNLRYSTSKDIASYLPAYDSTSRTVYQALFGVASYNNAWEPETLAADIETRSTYAVQYPSNGEFSINPYEMYEKMVGLYRCVETAPSFQQSYHGPIMLSQPLVLLTTLILQEQHRQLRTKFELLLLEVVAPGM